MVSSDAWALLYLDVRTDEGYTRALEQLAVLEEHGRPEDLSALVRAWVAPSWPPALCRVVSSVLAAVISRLPTHALPRVDGAIRRTSPTWGNDAWDRLGPSDVPGLLANEPQPVVGLGLLSCHASGYVREAAIRALTSRAEGLAWLLLRVNDWVVPVRLRATTAVVERIDAVHDDELLECLPLVLRLRALTRVAHDDLVARMASRIEALPLSSLRRALGHQDRAVRRALVGLLLERGRVIPELVDQALEDPDFVVRVRAARLLGLEPSPSAEPRRERLCQARSGVLRELALEQLVASASARARYWLEEGLHDPHRRVRETARFHLRALDQRRDFAAEYRARLGEGRRELGTVQGLAETGIASDWESMVAALDVDRKTAVAAIEGMRHLDAAGTRELRLMMVDDPRPSVSKAAARSVAYEIWATDEDTLREYLRSPLPHVRRHAMRLTVGLPGWRPGVVLLSHEEPSEQHVHHWALSRWSSTMSGYRAEVSAEEARILRMQLDSGRWRDWSQARWVAALLEWVAP